MSAALSVRQQAIVDKLSDGPQTTGDLAVACGYARDDRGGRNYVSLMITRLCRGHRYVISNLREPGTHAGGYYVLVSRPRPIAGERVRCAGCGRPIARDHLEDRYCSPCQRGLVDQELAFLAPPTLFGEMVPA